LVDMSILFKCTQLESFKSKSSANKISDFSFLSYLINLKSLGIIAEYIDNKNPLFSLPKSITYLYIFVRKCYNTEIFNAIPSCCNLIYLGLVYEDMTILPKLSCVNLKYLDLYGCSKLINITSLKICVNLKRVHMKAEHLLLLSNIMNHENYTSLKNDLLNQYHFYDFNGIF
jgi:hypothetical protein